VTVPRAGGAVVYFHPLHIGPAEDGSHEVGRPDTGVFVALPTEGVALLRWLTAGLSVDEAARRFVERFGVPTDVGGLVDGLAGCGFVRAVGDRSYQDDPGPVAGGSRGVFLLGNVPQRSVAWLLSRPMRVGYALVWLSVPALLLAVPRLRPVPADVLLLPRTLANILLISLLAWAFMLLHEAAHALAARALGCVGRLSLSRRLWFLAAQTDLSDIRTVPRSRRYGPYLAGMTWDLTLLLGCLVLQLAGVESPLVRAVGYLLAVALIFQCGVFMRTDLYFVIANRLRLADLMGDTRRLIGDVLRRMAGRRPRRTAEVPARELRIVRWYVVFYLLGSGAVTVGVALLTLPAMVLMIRTAVGDLGAGPTAVAWWDGLGFLLLVTTQLGALVWVTVTERLLRQEGRHA
jgi:putative peptide zinc metalloprotease protein